MEYFIFANSFAAPFCSDSDSCFIEAKNPEEAIKKFIKQYNHPCGLYAAAIYLNSNDYHKGKNPLLKWLCNHEIKKIELTKNKSSYTFLGIKPGEFKIDDKIYKVKNPKNGKIIYNPI